MTVTDETHVLDAYEAFSKGLINLRAESRESVDRAILFFERAVALDPDYARAWLALGEAYDVKATYLAMPELLEKAMASFEKCLALQPRLARAWKELGSTLVDLGREDKGLEAIRRALELDPGDGGSYAALGRAHFIGTGTLRGSGGRLRARPRAEPPGRLVRAPARARRGAAPGLPARRARRAAGARASGEGSLRPRRRADRRAPT